MTINELLIRYPKASALIPITLLITVYTVLTSISAVLQALALATGIIAIAMGVAVVKSGKDLGEDDDWWSPGGPRPV
ncbi:hypothetical protein Cp1R7AA1_001 [Mesorhizobium phage Cp1R7A-A1]|nr:hypothetical protein Cp1R7AA1_001 [Mesorhizobium phage Cp1R7A-A1]